MGRLGGVAGRIPPRGLLPRRRFRCCGKRRALLGSLVAVLCLVERFARLLPLLLDRRSGVPGLAGFPPGALEGPLRLGQGGTCTLQGDGSVVRSVIVWLGRSSWSRLH